jgi:hypothetical protein
VANPVIKDIEVNTQQPEASAQTESQEQAAGSSHASVPTDAPAPSTVEAEQPVAKVKRKTRIPAPTTELRRSNRVKKKPAWMSSGHWQLLQHADFEHQLRVGRVSSLIQRHQVSSPSQLAQHTQ